MNHFIAMNPQRGGNKGSASQGRRIKYFIR